MAQSSTDGYLRETLIIGGRDRTFTREDIEALNGNEIVSRICTRARANLQKLSNYIVRQSENGRSTNTRQANDLMRQDNEVMANL